MELSEDASYLASSWYFLRAVSVTRRRGDCPRRKPCSRRYTGDPEVARNRSWPLSRVSSSQVLGLAPGPKRNAYRDSSGQHQSAASTPISRRCAQAVNLLQRQCVCRSIPTDPWSLPCLQQRFRWQRTISELSLRPRYRRGDIDD